MDFRPAPGTPGCRAEALLDFLKHTECDTLYLVGDIIDGWQLRRQWDWPRSHNDVIQKLLRKARKGTRVIFIPGHHDEFARGVVGHDFGGIEVAEEWVHATADGRKLWVTHGDLFVPESHLASQANTAGNFGKQPRRPLTHLNAAAARGATLRAAFAHGPSSE